MGFRKQLVIGLAASVLVTILTAVTAIAALRLATTSADRISRQFASDLALVQGLRAHSEHLVAASRGLLLTGQPDQRARLLTAERSFRESLATLSRRGFLSRTLDEVARIERDAREYVEAVRRAGRDGVIAGEPRSMVVFFEEELAPRREAFEAGVDAFNLEAQALFDDAISLSEARARTAQATLLVTSLLGIAISVCLAVLVMRRLTRQFERAEAATLSASGAAAAREEILAVVSHDLRTPLTALVLSTEMLKDSTVLGPDEHRVVDTMSRATDRMQHLINDLVAGAQPDTAGMTLDRRSCSTAELLASATELFAERARSKQVRLKVRLEDFQIHVDQERVLQVLCNLLGNALKFCRAGDVISVSSTRNEAWARFEVADTGAGIAADQLPRLFERYWQGSERKERGSVGLGLYICKQIVDAHGGEIGVASEVGHGSTFWFELPC
ncbi:MAG: HAMP domain-containing histidine kinase [Deltaproteobacteria bacterium]|nr:HAMP domain-containing histidine kinase [Deltaproteobacteria bacterium]